MYLRFVSWFWVVLLTASIVGLTGCATTAPSRFYLLSPVTGPDKTLEKVKVDACVAIGIGPIELPQYLDRPQIVTRVSPIQLELAEFDKWAEPLKEVFSRVLAENLATMLCAEGIAVFPFRGSTPIDYQVRVEVTQFDGALGKNVMLMARWSILDGTGKRVLLTKQSTLNEPVNGLDYEALVGAQSRAVVKFSQEIAGTIKGVSRGVLKQ